MNLETLLLVSSLQACRQRIAKLGFSLANNQVLFPMALDTVTKLTEEKEEPIDALILRHSQCLTVIQEQLFKGIAFLEQEDMSDKSNREKRCLWKNWAPFSLLKSLVLRPCCAINLLTITPELNQARIYRLNLLPEESHFVIDTFKEIETYLETKKLIESPA